MERLKRRLGLHPTDADSEDWPPWYRAYRDILAQSEVPAADRLLNTITIVVLDAETTGLDVRTDRILSLGALRVYGNSIHLAEKFEAYLPSPSSVENSHAIPIHGIIPNSRRYTYSDEPSMLAELLDYLRDSVIVGHHIGFDIEMINRALARHGAGPLKNRVVDTVGLAKRLRPAGYWTPEGDYSLDVLARRYRIPLSDRHTALGDSYITAVLWLKLLTRLAVKLDRDLRISDL
ncbi:DNA polymerase III PolC-type [Neolewinella maritima]|uniref:DNA polymerase III PolC-type n=1 Tax=Neolewinella maritima TaxID=1383882 RepID=A0ABM9AZA3_9BACT|nr:DNA polymerase III PolC-type [Neolewinella maritima]